MKTYRARIIGQPTSETNVQAAEWRDAGRKLAAHYGVSADRIEVKVDTKVGFVRCTI